MTPSSRPSTKDRVFDVLFGGPATAEGRARALAERPPRWARRIIAGAFSLWAILFIGWCFGTLGWLPLPRETFPRDGVVAVNFVGLLALFLSSGIRAHYSKKARRSKKPASSE